MPFVISRYIYLRYIERKSWIKESEEKIQKTKTKIAFEMHQEIGSDLKHMLTKINYWSSKNNAENHDLKQLEYSTQKIISKVDEIVWSLKSEKVNLETFSSYIANYAREALANLNIDAEIKINSLLPKKELDDVKKRNLYLIFKEALNNSIKHAKASKLKIEIEYIKGIYQILISDNGIGFNPGEIIKGNGLDSMENRTKVLNGTLEIKHNEPTGTRVKIEIKI